MAERWGMIKRIDQIALGDECSTRRRRQFEGAESKRSKRRRKKRSIVMGRQK